jgi:hypothetical protein
MNAFLFLTDFAQQPRILEVLTETKLLQIEGVAWSVRQIPTAVFSVF